MTIHFNSTSPSNKLRASDKSGVKWTYISNRLASASRVVEWSQHRAFIHNLYKSNVDSYMLEYNLSMVARATTIVYCSMTSWYGVDEPRSSCMLGALLDQAIAMSKETYPISGSSIEKIDVQHTSHC